MQNKTTEAIVNNRFNKDELHRFSKADLRWIENKGKNLQTRKIRKGEIYQFEFGKNFQPEMSYEHRGLVIGVKDKLLYVLPICSYDPKKYPKVYHPIDFPDSKSDVYLLRAGEFSSIKHDSVLKLNDIRTISVNRILYQHDGTIDPSSKLYKRIEALVLNKYFAEFYFEFKNNKDEINSLKENALKTEKEIKELKEKISLLENNEKKLQEKIMELSLTLEGKK